MKKLHFWPIAWSLAIFLSLGYILDVLAGLLFPNWYVMQKTWELILPGYTFISWGAFFLGLLEIFVGGILIAVLFVPVYNFFARRENANQAPQMSATHQMKKLDFWPIAWTVTIFLALIYTLDVVAGLLFPNWYVMQRIWELVLPSFTYISWGAFFIGLLEIFVGGILIAVLFVPVYNIFAERENANHTPQMSATHQHS